MAKNPKIECTKVKHLTQPAVQFVKGKDFSNLVPDS